MKFRIINNKDSDKNYVVQLATALFKTVQKSNIKYVYVQYSKEMIPNGPLYADFELDV